MNKLWWRRPMRVVQMNLQVKDTPLMNPERMAEEVCQLCGNTLVINVGGIYAWYRSEIPYHRINPYLPKDKDILSELIDSCHRRKIKVVARFDFSKAEDLVYQQKPWWFVRNYEGKPTIYGKERPGEWSLLYSTCLHGGYRGEEFAVPVIREVLSSYDIDGVFLNAPHYEFCQCQICQDKYQEEYGCPLPHDFSLLESGWPSKSIRICTEKIYRAIKEKNKNIPLVLYYNPTGKEDIKEQLAFSDLLCTESQNILSAGQKNLPDSWKPAMTMKVGLSIKENSQEANPPIGIIHSCPGMDWRHTGLPKAEYLFWMAQIPANGGNIWHSITGFGETITDKSILSCVQKINQMAKICESEMERVDSAADVLLLWNGKESSRGWFEGLTATQRQFDVTKIQQITEEKLRKYSCVVIPEDFSIQQVKDKLIHYVKEGGRLIQEGTKKEELNPLFPLLGVRDIWQTSEKMVSSYLRISQKENEIFADLSDKELLPHRGQVAYVLPKADSEVPATLVPPFAPLDAVGAPPERASILSPKTDIPLMLLSKYQQGEVLFLPFQLSWLIREYGLPEHLTLMRNCADWGARYKPLIQISAPYGLQVSTFQNENSMLIHFVNGVGRRPLTAIMPLYHLEFTVLLPPNMILSSVSSCLGNQKIYAKQKEDFVICRLEKLEIWDMIKLEWKKRS